MTKPVALVFYERLLPGSQLVNRLQDLGYHAITIATADALPAAAYSEKPLFIVLDVRSDQGNIISAIKQVKQTAETAHIPILGFSTEGEEELQLRATEAGANLVAFDDAILPQLPQLIEHVLQIE